MPAILLTFLGTGNYQPCRYQVDPSSGQNEVTFFSVALARTLRPDKVISLQTAAATATNGSALDAAFSQCGIPHHPVSIPDGQSEAELWQIFAALTGNVPEDSTLHLDITHGFRSLPVLGFIALSYLRVTRKVTIGGIHYGAWEARDKNNLAPVFNLTPFLTLLDWTAAADQFLSTGSAARLGGLLAQAQQSLWKNAGANAHADLPRKLKSLGSSLETSSANLLLLRTGALSDAAIKLGKQMEIAKDEAAAHASPFLEVLAPVQEQLLKFQDTELATLRDLVGWLAGRGQTAAALTLASEWLTSYVMVTCGQANHFTGYSQRQPYSLAISSLEQPENKITSDETGRAALAARDILLRKLSEENLKSLARLASTIRSARNDLNHAGFNDDRTAASALATRAIEVAESLRQLLPP